MPRVPNKMNYTFSALRHQKKVT